MTPPRIVFLDADSLGEASLAPIAALGKFTAFPSSTPQQARVRLMEADVAIVNKVVVDEMLLAAAPRLRLVCESATGLDNIDLSACERAGVAVRNVAGYSTDSVAQIAWMHILNLAGHAFHYDQVVRSGVYSTFSVHNDAAHPFMELAGKWLGIVGMGAIGQRVAALGAAFGMRVRYFSTSGTGHCKDWPSVDLQALLSESDVVSIHAPLNERTRGLLDYARLRQMKPTAYLVNTGRGGIVVEADLARALDEGVIAGAAVDVYGREPIPVSHPYLHMAHPERLRFSPHIGYYSLEARERLVEGVAENIRTFLSSCHSAGDVL